MTQVGTSLKTKIPEEIREEAVKLGKKQTSKLPAAVLDGPFPIADTALLLLALGDVTTGTIALKGTFQQVIETTIKEEGNAVILEAYNHTIEQVLRAEQVAHLERCQALGHALNGLLKAARHAEVAQRCN